MVATRVKPAAVSSPSLKALAPEPTFPAHLSDLPRMEGTFIGANLKAFAEDGLKAVREAFEQHGDLVRLRMGPIKYLLVSHPDAVHHILTENQRNYRKDTKGYQTMKKIVGNGLLTSNGEFWLRQRRIAQPAFHRQRVASFADTMVACTEEMLEQWQWRMEGERTVDVANEMMKLTLRIIGLTMMSVDLERDAADIGKAVSTALVRTDELIVSMPFADKIPNAKNRAFNEARALLASYLGEIISERREKIALAANAGDEAAMAAIPGDLLTMLLESTDPETGEHMDDQQLLDEMMTIFLAGHETTANALAWTFRLLTKHQDVYAKLEAEVDAVAAGLGGAPIGLKDLEALPYTKQVMQESMRLYPPAWIVGRNVVEDDVLCGVKIPGGTNVFISPWLLHRHPRYWEDPKAFKPERFAGDPKLPKGLYIPFIEGPRQCIGKAFAMMEAQLVLANIVRRARLTHDPAKKVGAEPLITLRPLGGLRMRVTERQRPLAPQAA